MKILFESRDPEAARLRDVATGRLRFVMRRLAWLVSRAELRLMDVNGPRGGVDKQCQVELATRRAGTVRITALARDWRSAIEAALVRAARVLVRNVQRSRARRRSARGVPVLGH